MSLLSEHPSLEEINNHLKVCSDEMTSQPENNDAPEVLTNYKKYIASLEGCLYKEAVTAVQTLAEKASDLDGFKESLKEKIAHWSFEYSESPLGIMQSAQSKVNLFLFPQSATENPLLIH